MNRKISPPIELFLKTISLSFKGELLYQVEDSDSTFIITDIQNAEKVLRVHEKKHFKVKRDVALFHRTRHDR